MSLAVVTEFAVEPEFWSTAELGVALVELGARAASADGSVCWPSSTARGGWHLDGQLSAVDWLVWCCGMAAERLDGTAVGTETRRRLPCACGVVPHLFRGRSQPLDIGTRTSVWTVAQRRAISLRDQGAAASFPAGGEPVTSTTCGTTT